MPRRTLSLILSIAAMGLGFGLAGCGGTGTGAQGISRSVTLTSGQETAAVTSSATGTATVAITPNRQQVVVTVNTTGLTNVTMAHIHAGLTGSSGLMGENAPVVFTLYDSAQGAFNGTIARTLNISNFTPQAGVGINTFTDAITAILQGRAYINIHTQANPGGELRGQVLPASFTTQLSGANEVPPTNLVSRGSAAVTIDPATRTVTISGSTGLLQTTSVTMGHIHVGATGVNGPVIFPFFNSAQGPYLGTFNRTLTEANLTPQPGSGVEDFNDAINAIITGNAYVNIHTTDNPSGAIRGQLGPTENQ